MHPLIGLTDTNRHMRQMFVLRTFVVVGCPPVAEQGEEEEEGGESLRSPHHTSNLKHHAKHCRVISHIRTHR